LAIASATIALSCGSFSDFSQSLATALSCRRRLPVACGMRVLAGSARVHDLVI
jgi:hypothetical protein